MHSIAAKRLISAVLALAITSFALWWLLHDGAGQALLAALWKADFRFLALAACLAILIQMIRAWRFAILANGKATLPSWIMIGIATRLILLNFMLPFKLGELGFPVMMKRSFGTPFAEGAGILILSRLLDFSVVTAILLLTGAYLLTPPIIGWSQELVACMGIVILILPILLIGWAADLRRLARPWPRIERLTEKMSVGALMARPAVLRSLVFGLTCLIWSIHALIAFLTAASIQAGIGFLPLAMASAASNLAFALPISGIAGLGPPQAAWASVLNLSDVDWTSAITTALLCHGLLLITISTWGVLGYLQAAIRPKNYSSLDKRHP